MSTHSRLLLSIILVTSCLGGPSLGDDARAAPWPGALQRSDGRQLRGKLVAGGPSEYRFVPDGGDGSLRLERGAVVAFDAAGPDPTAGSLPFRMELGLGRKISGRMGRMTGDLARLESSSAAGRPVEARGGVAAIVQRQGEMQMLDEGFETLDRARWRVQGDVAIGDDPHVAGEHSLRVPAHESSVTYKLPDPVPAGRLELAFHDTGAVAAGNQCFVDLFFRGGGDPGTVRAILGWSEESHSVETPGGPALAVQRLARKSGWHRLIIRFGPGQTEISIDGNDLAHGKGPGGQLVEIRLASHVARGGGAPEDLSTHFDDLRLVRFAEASGGLEVDPTQDEVRLAAGDQLFGSLVEADAQRIRFTVNRQPIVLPWSQASGIHLRRVARQSEPVEGLIVRVDWRSSPDDPRDFDRLDGVLESLSSDAITLSAPYLGRVMIPRRSVSRLEVLGSGRRIVIDPTSHHLGDEIRGSILPLDPPQPEARSLERTLELTTLPAGEAHLTLDVVQVAGEATGLPFADMVKKGELRTTVRINGKEVDYLNRHIASNNETPERIRIPVPSGVLNKGRNLVRLEQVGSASAPDDVDDLGVLEMAVEFTAGGPTPVAPGKP